MGAAWLVAWRMVTRVLGVASTLIMARILVPSDYGLLAMATTFAATIDAFSQLGVQEALIRRREDDERLHDTAFTLQLGRAVLTGAAIAAAAPMASRWFGEPRLMPILLILAATSAVSGLQNIGVVAFRRDIEYGRQFLFLCVPRLLQVVIAVPVALVFRSYWALVVGIVVAKLAELVLSYAIHPYRPRLSLECWRDLAAFSLWTWASSLGSIIWNRCDPFVIGPVIGAGPLGIYLLAAEVASLPVSELIIPVSDVLLGGFSLSQRQGGSPISAALPVATTLLFAIMPMMLAVSATSGFIVASLLGSAWTAAGPLIAIAAWLGLFSPFSFVCGTALVSANHVRSNFVANSLASACKLAGLCLTVFLTSDPLWIMVAGVVIVGLEAAIFVACLMQCGNVALRDTVTALGRLLCSSIPVLLLVWVSGVAWRKETMPSWLALLAGAGLGACITGAFAVAAFAVWRLAGRPEGPETRLGQLIRHAAMSACDKGLRAFPWLNRKAAA